MAIRRKRETGRDRERERERAAKRRGEAGEWWRALAVGDSAESTD